MEKESMTGACIYPFVLDSAYTVDIDTAADWRRAEWLLSQSDLNVVQPDGRLNEVQINAMLTETRLLVLDFDGVMTDNRVLVDEHGTESVHCHRGDGWGISSLKKAGIEILVLSTEANLVVAARCRKLDISCIQRCRNKLSLLKEEAILRDLDADKIVYVGNDVNDLECLRWVGLPVAVADAMPEVKAVAKWVTAHAGGQGAIREVADALLRATADKRSAQTASRFHA